MPIPLLTTVSSVRRLRCTLPPHVSLVPTMGMLHRGHCSLIRLAASRSSYIIISIYINPTQLSPTDRDAYPSTLQTDIEVLERLDEDLRREDKENGRIVGIFAPGDAEMYPNRAIQVGGVPGMLGEMGTYVNVAPLADGRLEGIGQPAHFIGVATVCLKLFHIVKPDKAFFGKKDYHQIVLVKRMVEDFLLDVEIIAVETVREEDGLAVSSRNVFLGQKRRDVAPILWSCLQAGAYLYRVEGKSSSKDILGRCYRVAQAEQERQRHSLMHDGVDFDILYFALSDLRALEDMMNVASGQGALLSGAIEMLPQKKTAEIEDTVPNGGTKYIRLIDSIELHSDVECN